MDIKVFMLIFLLMKNINLKPNLIRMKSAFFIIFVLIINAFLFCELFFLDNFKPLDIKNNLNLSFNNFNEIKNANNFAFAEEEKCLCKN